VALNLCGQKIRSALQIRDFSKNFSGDRAEFPEPVATIRPQLYEQDTGGEINGKVAGQVNLSSLENACFPPPTLK
jgi:hypothetical protein